MPSSQTCSACRGRKVRCDGVLPMCGPCSKARRPIECVYTSTAVSFTPKGEYLKKGAACAPCRRKKKKCDAIRPFCSTCKVAGKEKECVYDESVDRTLTEALFLRTHILEQRLAAYENQVTEYSPSQLLSESSYAASSVVPLDPPIASSSSTPLPLPTGTGPFGPDNIPMYNFPQALNILFDRLTAPSPTADIHTLSTPHIPQGLEEFRAAYATHAVQYGGVLPAEKMQAILTGDLSGRVVHPAFTHLGQLLGCVMWQIQRRMFIFAQVEYEQLQHVFLALEDIDPVSEIQVRYLLTIYYLLKKQMEEGEEQLLLAVNVVRQNNITFPIAPDTLDPMNYPTSDQVELISALSHLIYLDRVSAFVFHVPTRLESSFDEAHKNVALYYPFLAKTSLTWLRSRSLLLFLRVRDLTAQWASINASTHGGMFSPARPAWFESYWVLLDELGTHATNLEGEMLRNSFYGEREYSVALKFCLVVALTGKAQMHWLIRRDHVESAQRAMDVIMEIVNITRTFKDNEFLLLDPLLGVCWSSMARIMVEVMREQLHPDIISWNTMLQTIDTSVKKLAYDIPFMEEPIQQISESIRIVEVPP